MQENKNVLENKKCASVAHYGIELCLPCITFCYLVWPYVASYGLVAFHGHDHEWPHST